MMVEVAGLTYCYPGVEQPALVDVSFEVEPGAVVAVVGANGAGKSTLCLALGGFVPHHFQGTFEGDVRVAGQSVQAEALGQWVTRVGVIFQNPAHQLTGARETVFEEVAFGLENLGVPRAEMQRRVAEMLARLGIEDLADRSPFALSGGQMQRVAIASILVMQPQVLVLDEPTAQLDPQGAQDVLAVVRALAREGTPIVIATHQVELVADFATHALVLAEGRVVSSGPAETILSDPALEGLGVVRPLAARVAESAGWTPPWPVTVAGVAARAAQGPQKPVVATGAIAGATLAIQAAEEQGASSDVPELVPAARPTLVVADDIWFTYPSGVVALRGVSMRLAPGTVTALVGENGAGKSTLGRVLMGLLTPEAGRVQVGDQVATFPLAKGIRREIKAGQIGYVFQNPDEQLFLTRVWDEVAFGPRNLGLRGEALTQTVTRALMLTDLTAVADEHPHDLRPDQRRWVALASVLAMGPEALILDEPTSGQDLFGQSRLAQLVRRLRASGHTLVVVTHDLGFAAAVSDQIVVMAGGQIQGVGAPAALLGNAALLTGAGLLLPMAVQLAQALALRGVVSEAALLAEARVLRKYLS